VQINEVYVTPHLAVPEWARLSSALLVVASIAPAGQLPTSVEDAFMRDVEAIDHPTWALAYCALSMRNGSTYEIVAFDLTYAGIGARNIPARDEVAPFLGQVG
jgi:hypothetical protein